MYCSMSLTLPCKGVSQICLLCADEEIFIRLCFSCCPVPPAPRNVSVYRLSDSVMFVSWNQIPLTISRGFVLNYSVVYLTRDRKRNPAEVMVSGTLDNTVITGLDSSQQYVVSVSAVTSAGRGNASSQSILSLPVSDDGFTVTTIAIIAALVGIILILLATIIILLM